MLFILGARGNFTVQAITEIKMHGLAFIILINLIKLTYLPTY